MFRTIVLGAALVSQALAQQSTTQAVPIPIQPPVPPTAGTRTPIQPAPNQPGPNQPTQPAEPKEPAKISGKVTNSTTGQPLKRASVTMYPAEPGPDMVPLTTVTDAEGVFAMAEIPPGKYRLSVERTGFVRAEFGARGKSRMGTTITLVPGQDMRQVNAALEPHAVITGRVTDEDGEPLAHAYVQPMMYRFMQGRRQLMPAGGSQTNDLGEYRVFGLAPGRYYLSAVLRNMSMGMGSVDRSAGTPQNDGFATTYYPGTTDPSGAVQITVTAGQPVTGMDIRLRRIKTARIRGRIVNAGNPASRPMVFLNARDTSGGMMMFDRGMAPVRGADGKFELRGIAPGAYHLTAQSFDGQDRFFARIPVDVGTENIDGLELTLQPGLELKGIVRVEGEGQVSPSGIRVMLEPKEMSPMGGGGMSVSKDDGSFTIRSAVPDTYRVRIQMAEGQGFLKSIYLGEQEAKDGEITLAPGISPLLNLLVSTAAAEISGKVKGEKDAPVQGAFVVLVPETSKRQQQGLYKTATTDQYGGFSLTSIAPGTYKVFAWDSVDYGEWMDPDFIQSWEGKGVSYTVKEGSKETADLTLLKTQNAAAP